MNLVEAPDHAGPTAPPHAPEERLRTLLAGDATRRMMRRPRVKWIGSKKRFSLKLIVLMTPRIRDEYFCPWGGRSRGARKFLATCIIITGVIITVRNSAWTGVLARPLTNNLRLGVSIFCGTRERTNPDD